MQDNQKFWLNTDKQDVLFSELDWNVNFDEIVQKSYELHPTNAYFEQSSPIFDLDSCLESKVKPLDICSDLKISDQGPLRRNKLDMICKDSIDCNQSYIYKDNNSSVFVGWKEGFIADSKKDKEFSINCLELTQQSITNTKIFIHNCSFQKLQLDNDKIKGKFYIFVLFCDKYKKIKRLNLLKWALKYPIFIIVAV